MHCVYTYTCTYITYYCTKACFCVRSCGRGRVTSVDISAIVEEMNCRTVPSVELLSLLALLACLSSAQDQACNPPKDVGSGVATCMCQTDNGVIDLNPLANKDGKPRYSVYSRFSK